LQNEAIKGNGIIIDISKMNKLFIALCLLAFVTVSLQKKELDEDLDEETTETKQYSVSEDASLPTGPVYGRNADVLLDERIKFTQSVNIRGNTWQEIPTYTRTFETTKSYVSCRFEITVPFAGTDSPGTRNRMLLLFDDEAINDNSFYSQTYWFLPSVAISSHKTNVKSGTHTLRLMAAVNGGTLQFPHYNAGLSEATLKPSIFATMDVICFQ